MKSIEESLQTRKLIPVTPITRRNNFTHFSIARKLVLSFLSLLILLFVVSIYTLVNLNKLNQFNISILDIEFPIINSCSKLIDLILVQEQYARRQILYKDPEMDKLYLEKDEEINGIVENIKRVKNDKGHLINRFESNYQKYTELLISDLPKAINTSRIDANKLRTEIETTQEELIKITKAISNQANKDLLKKAGVISSIGSMAFKSAIIIFAIGLIFSIVLSVIITRNISGAVKKLKVATEMLATGRFDGFPVVKNKDELGELSIAFTHMSQRLKKLEELNLHKSPLTKIPGGIAIEENLQNRIDAKEQIAFCLIDIDNFKSYNDYYGYAKGNTFIKKTSEIIQEAIIKCGTTDDFVGHIGGDDFVVITKPKSYKDICESIIDLFDQMTPHYYSTEDYKRNFIKVRNRQREVVKYPVASISIAVVTNCNKTLESHLEYGEIAAELKAKLKSLSGSNYMIDRRKENNYPSQEKSNVIRTFEYSKTNVQ